MNNLKIKLKKVIPLISAKKSKKKQENIKEAKDLHTKNLQNIAERILKT